MRKRLLITAGAATLVVAMAIPMFASGATNITARMDGSQIVNPRGGDPDGTARLRLRVNRARHRLCFRLTFQNLSSQVTGAFIHKGAAGQIARPIITLFNTRETSPVRQCEHNVRGRLLRRLKRRPALHYADVDTRAYPNGAVRGQLSR
jgi:CHRD domain